MKLAIFGATGPTGQELVKQGLERGHDITALARDPTKLAVSHPRFKVVQGNALDPAAVERAIAGQDAVVSSLGGSGRGNTHLYSESAKIFVAVMQKVGVRRIVICTSGGVEHDDPSFVWWYRLFIKPMLKGPYADMKLAEEILAASNLDWVVVRPPMLTNGPRTGKVQVSPRFGPGGRWSPLSRADVAAFMLDQVSGDAWLKKTPTLG